jgi:hypothetical protein
MDWWSGRSPGFCRSDLDEMWLHAARPHWRLNPDEGRLRIYCGGDGVRINGGGGVDRS